VLTIALLGFDVDPRTSRTVRFEVKHRSGVPGAAAQLSSAHPNSIRQGHGVVAEALRRRFPPEWVAGLVQITLTEPTA
jgi:hypothetical protein